MTVNCGKLVAYLARIQCFLMRATYKNYITPYYSNDTYVSFSLNMIHSLSYKYKWPHIDSENILPLDVQIQLGKPKICKTKVSHEPLAFNKNYVESLMLPC